MKKRQVNLTNSINWKILIICIIISYSIAGIGSIFTTNKTNSEWYNSIKPSLTPPNWVFPIVWNILFFLISISLYIVWTEVKNKKIKQKLFLFFGLNLTLNVLWSLFYFTLEKPLIAFFDLILLWFSIFFLIKISLKEKRKISWLLLPYLLWISFAGILNYLSI